MSRYWPWICLVGGVELVSALTFLHPQAQTLALSICVVAMFFTAIRRPAVASSALLIEFVIGSKGALLRAGGDGLGHGGISLRIALFIAFFAGWLVWSIQHKTYQNWKGYLKGREIYIGLGILLVYAFGRGVFLHNAFTLADANAWGVWLLLLPALDLAKHEQNKLKEFLPYALGVAFAWLCMKTLVLFYLFSHVTSSFVLNEIYLWVRRTGVGEITRAIAGMNAWRVFFQSHIYLLPVIIGMAWYALFHERLSKRMWGLWMVAWATLIVSLSRSLFMGLVVGLVGGLVIALVAHQANRFKGLYKTFARVLAAVIGGLLLVTVLFYAPPRSNGSLRDLLASRVDAGDDASASRWTLLPALWGGIKKHAVLGSGFGATVTYASRDPRVVAATGGVYTTYAFEWGWLEHWFKFGILGIPLMFLLVVRLGWRMWHSEYDLWFRGAMISSLLALVVTHMFTPYLNHPLGIIWLITFEAIV